MLSLKDSTNDGSEKIPLVDPTCITQGSLSPALTSCKSNQDDKSENLSLQHTNLPGTVILETSALASVPDYSDFVDSDEEYEVEERSEDIIRYTSGKLYCPICNGEVFLCKHRIEHKLGNGGSSTVWMAHDINQNKDVALMIIISGEAGEYELNMRNEIMRTV